jgi:hypothetical protein
MPPPATVASSSAPAPAPAPARLRWGTATAVSLDVGGPATRAGGRSHMTVKLGNHNAFGVPGVVTLTAGSATLGTRSFALPPSSTVTLHVVLTTRAAATLKRRGTLHVTCHLRLRDPSGALRRITRRVTLHAPRPRVTHHR